MPGYRKKIIWIALLAALGASVMVIGGCVTSSSWEQSLQGGTERTSAVPLPEYQVGTKFIYSNGTWQKVAKVGGGQVEWSNQKDNITVAKVDFTYRSLKWQNKKFSGSRSFVPLTYLSDSPRESLWPLAQGNSVNYDEHGMWAGKDGIEHSYHTFWHCEVKGEKKIKVPAGDFDTWKLSCSRYTSSKKYPRALSWEDKTWYYAPVIHHWVVEEQDYHGYRSSRRQELVAVLPDLTLLVPDEEERGEVKKHFQNSLEYKKNGKSDLWKSMDGKTSVMVTPRKSFRHSEGNVCRQYEQKITVGIRVDTWFGVACKTKEGIWQIPRR